MRDYCAICGARINPRPVDGSDPDDAATSFWEIYECDRGHTGRLDWDADQGAQTTGALREQPEAIA